VGRFIFHSEEYVKKKILKSIVYVVGKGERERRFLVRRRKKKKYRETAVDASNPSFKTLSSLSGREKKNRKKPAGIVFKLIARGEEIVKFSSG